MASMIFARECPQCGRSAVEDYYYKTEVTTIVCYRCGYSYTKKIVEWIGTSIEYQEEECKGYGVISIVKKDGKSKFVLIQNVLTPKQIDHYREDLLKDDTDKEKSFQVTYKEGIFTIEYGTPSENFHLPFEEYKAKMTREFGEDEFSDILVPISD